MHEIRRKDRALTPNEAVVILQKGLYGTLACADDEAQPYAVPLFYVYMDGVIYFHCANEGHKLENIKANNKVCFNVVGDFEVIPDRFAAYYSSATAFGRAEIAADEDKRKALVAITEKYSSDFRAEGMAYIDRAYKAVTVVKITVESVSGKARSK